MFLVGDWQRYFEPPEDAGVRQCPNCGSKTRHWQLTRKTQANVFFIPVGSTSSTFLACRECEYFREEGFLESLTHTLETVGEAQQNAKAEAGTASFMSAFLGENIVQLRCPCGVIGFRGVKNLVTILSPGKTAKCKGCRRRWTWAPDEDPAVLISSEGERVSVAPMS